MKILAIRIKNLASLEGDYQIDFGKEPLASAGIFAITGPTGSGKSTILDAICLALFAKTPRHNNKEKAIDINDVGGKIKLGDTRGILRKGEYEGRAEVDFAGADGNIYNATWSVRRARSKADGAMQAENVELTNLTTNAKYPGKKTETLAEIERLAGLNFEQFTRSVLLAQGDFTAFLKAEKSEKSSLLEKLTGTDVYSDISKLIYQRYKEADLEIKHLQRQIAGIELLSPDALTATEEQIIALTEQIAQLQHAQTKLTEGINWHKTLEELDANQQNAAAAQQTAYDVKTAAAASIAYFRQVELVQEARTLTDKKAAAQQTLGTTTQEWTRLNAAIERQTAQKNATAAELQNAETQLHNSEQAFAEAQPLIDRAKTLDTLLKEKQAQNHLAEQAVEAAARNAQQQQQAIADKEREGAQIARQISELKEWKSKHAGNEPVAENIKLILSKLADAGVALARQKTTERKITETLAKAAANEKQIAALDKQVKDKEAVIGVLMADVCNKSAELAGYNIAGIRAEETAATQLADRAAEAKNCWDILYARRAEQNKLTAKLRQCTEDIALRTRELQQNMTALRDAALLKDHAQKMLDRARLESAANVEQLRDSLTDGEPCPVCGSDSHPYAGHSHKLNNVLDGLQREYEHCNATYIDLLTQGGSLEKLCETLEKSRATLVVENDDVTKAVADLTDRWTACGMEGALQGLPHEQYSEWLTNHMAMLRNKLADLKARIGNHDQMLQALQMQKDELATLNAELAAMRQTLTAAQRDVQAYEAETDRLKEELAETRQHIAGIVGLLSPYFVKPDWHENWQAEPAAFEQRLTAFVAEWHKKTQMLDTAVKKQDDLTMEVDYMNRQMTALDDARQKANAAFAASSAEVITLADDRKTLFAGAPIPEVERRYKADIEQWKQQAANWKAQLEKTDAELNKMNGNAEQLTRQITDSEAALQEANRQISEWLRQANAGAAQPIDEDGLYALLMHNSAWITAERNRIAAIDDAIKTAEATYNERKQQTDSHRARALADESREELEALLAAANEKAEAAAKEKSEQAFRIRKHYDNKEQISGIEAEIAAKQGVCENWQKLDDLVGSATGEKFRQIAQEYTLDVLLGFANIQIRALASRYKLERIPNSLALQVIDTDMGNEIRSVHSLSGGESFLVSLALALGLASLSSNRMKVESLFIDEGFGTLDEETLIVAMEALDRLQNQGRKVGVITHVREMTERITTKIKVTKLAGGRSRIDVVG